MSLFPHDALRAANRRGVLAMSAGMCCFVSNDALVKFVSQSTLEGPELARFKAHLAKLMSIGSAAQPSS